VFDVEGTLREDVLFHSVGTFPTLYAMKGNRVAVCVPQPDLPSHEHDTLFRIDLAFTGAGANETTPVLMEGTPRRYNFYEQYTPQGVTDVTGGKRIVYPNVYDSIDVHLYSNQWGPKLYLVVRPGGNPNDITIAWSGQDSLNLDVDGFLKVWFFQKFIKLTQGLAYQQQGENTVLVPWEATYTIDANGLQTGFQFGGYDPELPLILIVRPLNPNEALPGGGGSGPPEWCTFLAGAHDDRMLDVTHDPDGNVYVTGKSRSVSGLPIQPGVAFQPDLQGLTDAVVGKFNEHYEIEDGAGWMTYFGGSDSDKGVALAYDQVNGRVAVTGAMGEPFTFPNIPFAGNPGAYGSIGTVPFLSQFIAWFDEQTGHVQYFSRTPGHLVTDHDGDVEVDAYGNTYVVGRGLMPNIDAELAVNPPGAYAQPYHGEEPIWPEGTGFVMRLDPEANLTWFTTIGGPRNEFVHACKVDPVHDLLYIVGSTRSPNDPGVTVQCDPGASYYEFPLCPYPGGYNQSLFNGSSYFPPIGDNYYDGFIIRFKLSDLTLDWSTYMGGAMDEGIFDVAVDKDGRVYVAGWSETPYYAANTCAAPTDMEFPHCDAGGFYEPVAAGKRYFIARFDLDAKLSWCTKFGDNATGTHEPIALALDEADNVYLHHSTYHPPGYTPPLPPLPASGLYHQGLHNDWMLGGKSDTYVAMFSPGTDHLYTTFFGGIGHDIARGITATTERLYVCGYTLALANFPVHAPDIPGHQPYLNPTPQAVPGQDRADGYIAQLRQSIPIGMDEQAQAAGDGLLIYPNPAQGDLQVRLPNNFTGRGELMIVDKLGRYVQRHVANGLRGTLLPVRGLAPGMYSVVLTQGGRIWQGRFIVTQ
jgi:hypothetical protein